MKMMTAIMLNYDVEYGGEDGGDGEYGGAYGDDDGYDDDGVLTVMLMLGLMLVMIAIMCRTFDDRVSRAIIVSSDGCRDSNHLALVAHFFYFFFVDQHFHHKESCSRYREKGALTAPLACYYRYIYISLYCYNVVSIASIARARDIVR